MYDLFAVSQHYGSLGGGHYTAACQGEDGAWHAFNDSSVDALGAMDPADSARSAYVLFYRRQQDWRASPSARHLSCLLSQGVVSTQYYLARKQSLLHVSPERSADLLLTVGLQ